MESAVRVLGLQRRCWGNLFAYFFYKVMMVKNASLWDLRSGGRVKDLISAVISAQIEDKYSLTINFLHHVKVASPL